MEKLTQPVKGKLDYDHIISQKFGECATPKLCQLYNGMRLKAHNGIDFRGDRKQFPSEGRGTPIYSAHGGIVVYAQEFKSMSGKSIKIMGNGFYTIYLHNDELLVKKGDQLRAEQQIAKMGNSGSDYYYMAVHLHFGLYKCDENGNRLNINNGYRGAIDPLPFLTGDTSMKRKKIYQCYHEILLREPTDKEYDECKEWGETALRSHLGTLKERKRIISIINFAKRFKLI